MHLFAISSLPLFAYIAIAIISRNFASSLSSSAHILRIELLLLLLSVPQNIHSSIGIIDNKLSIMDTTSAFVITYSVLME